MPFYRVTGRRRYVEFEDVDETVEEDDPQTAALSVLEDRITHLGWADDGNEVSVQEITEAEYKDETE